MQEQKADVHDAKKVIPLRLTKQIGSTTYRVSVHFSKTSRETLGDKVVRLIQSGVVNG